MTSARASAVTPDRTCITASVTFLIARRSQIQFTTQWDQTGTLNGLVEETHTGHALVQLAARGRGGR